MIVWPALDSRTTALVVVLLQQPVFIKRGAGDIHQGTKKTSRGILCGRNMPSLGLLHARWGQELIMLCSVHAVDGMIDVARDTPSVGGAAA